MNRLFCSWAIVALTLFAWAPVAEAQEISLIGFCRVSPSQIPGINVVTLTRFDLTSVELISSITPFAGDYLCTGVTLVTVIGGFSGLGAVIPDPISGLPYERGAVAIIQPAGPFLPARNVTLTGLCSLVQSGLGVNAILEVSPGRLIELGAPPTAQGSEYCDGSLVTVFGTLPGLGSVPGPQGLPHELLLVDRFVPTR